MAPGDMGGYYFQRGGKLWHARNVPKSIFNTLIVGFGNLLFYVVAEEAYENKKKVLTTRSW